MNLTNEELDNLTEDEIDEMLKLMEFEEFRRASRNEIYNFVEVFPGRYIILIGGSGSGKSYDIADTLVDKVAQEPNSRILGVRKEQKQVTESIFPLLESRADYYYPKTFNVKRSQGNEKIMHPSGGEILFSGLDKVEKLKSIFDITSVWIEEADQAEHKDVTELDRRLRGYKQDLMKIFFTFNPVTQLSYLKKYYFDNRVKEYKVLFNGMSHVEEVDGIEKTVWTGGQSKTMMLDRVIAMRGEVPFNDYPHWRDINITEDELQRKIVVWFEDDNMPNGGEWEEQYFYNTLIIHSTYRDNRFIDNQYRQVMSKQKEDDPDEYNVYGLGQWGIIGGIYFDKTNVNKRIQDAPKPLRRGYFEFDGQYETNANEEPILVKVYDNTIRFVDDPTGDVKLFESPKPRTPYVVGGDTAGDGSDYNTATLINNLTGVDIASIRTQMDEDEYARQVYCLGKYFGELHDCHDNALVGIEVNFSTHPNKELERLGYDNLYVRDEAPDKFTAKLTKKFGWHTNTLTRPLALGKLRAVMRQQPSCIRDRDTLEEMTTFVKNEKGKPEAAKGFHDDMIMARAITEGVREQAPDTIKIIEDELDFSKIPADRMEDYYNCRDDEMRKLMIRRWRSEGIV